MSFVTRKAAHCDPRLEPSDRLGALSEEWHGSGYVQKWEDFLFGKLMEAYSEIAALTDAPTQDGAK